MSTDTDVIEDLTTDVTNDDGDHERLSHYVKKEAIIASTFDGIPAVALCGKVWVANKSPEKFPVCPECKDIYESLKE